MSEILDYADKLRSQIDIADVIGKYVQLRRLGANYKGLCPFHNEKTPSFTVSASKQIFHCFGCHAGGDVIRFVQRIERLEWIEAVRYLSREYGISMPEMRRSTSDSQENKDARIAAMEVTQIAASLFAENLRKAVDANGEIAEYLNGRKLSSAVVNEFQLGLAPDAWTVLLDTCLRKGYKNEAMLNAGLVIKHHEKDRIYDRFRNRLMFPIQNTHGDTVAFGARVYAKSASPDEPKYINSPESLIYHKGQTLYALNIAKDHIVKAQKAILMEGYMDVIRAHSCGLRTAIASCGTALTDEQARTLKRFCSNVVFAYDADNAGQKAMLRGTEILLEHGFNVQIMSLPEGHDPDSYLEQEGVSAFQKQVEGARNFYDHFIGVATRAFDVRSPEGKVQAVELMLPLLRRIKQPILKSDYTNKLADRLNISPLLIQRQLRGNNPAAIDRLRSDVVSANAHQTSLIEKTLLKLMIECPPARDRIRASISADWLKHPDVRKWFLLCCEMQDVELSWESIMASREIESEEEEAFLRELAVMEEKCDSSARTIDNVAARLQRHHHKELNQLLVQEIDNFYESAENHGEIMDKVRIADEHLTPVKGLVNRYFLKNTPTDRQN